MILDLPEEKRDRWVVLSEENLRKHNLGARDVETHQTQIGKGALHLSQVGLSWGQTDRSLSFLLQWILLLGTG